MDAFVCRLSAMIRRFRDFAGSRAGGRRGMTFAEALVMIVVAGSLMIPVIGTLQSGVDRTDAYIHQDRMRTIAQSKMTEILAGSAYARTPVVDYIATVSWPVDDPEPVATYMMEVETLDEVQLATLTSIIKGDFAASESQNLVGTQPANLKTIVITVTHIPDVGSEPQTTPAQVRLFSMVAIPKSFNPNRIYIADKDNICFYAVDPLSRNVVETFDMPFSKTPKTKTENNPFRPGNIGVHPNSEWVVSQREKSLLLTDVALYSPTRRSSIQVYATSTTFLENSADNEKIRKDRGVAFRPDGRYCYVTSHSPSGLSIFSVPETRNASFPLVKFLPIAENISVDLQVGDDGYLYIPGYSYTAKCFRRLNMFTPQALAVLEDYSLPGWLTSPNKKPMAACTSRDGRSVYSIWEGPYIASSSSENPGDWGCAFIGYTPALGAEDIQDIQVSGDNKLVLATSKQGGGKTRIYAFPVEMKGSTINPWGAPNTIAYPGSGDITNQAILSPAMNDIWVDRKSAGEIYALDTDGLLAGSYTTSIPTERTVIFQPNGDAGCVAARGAEMVAVGCGVANTIEFIDPWSKHHYENLQQKLPFKPAQIAYNGAGSRLSVCYDLYNSLPSELDVFNNKRLADIDPEGWTPTANRRPTHHVYFQDGGYLILKYGTSVSANGYVAIDKNGVKVADIDFPLTASMSDAIPLPDGGALVLVTDFVASWTRLDWIGPDASVYAKWDSRFDNFPPLRATRMAVNANASLLALYVSNYAGAGEGVQIFDFRSSNFGTLTQQTGLICDYRSGSKTTFDGPVPSDVKMTAATYKLKDNFTCNDPIANMVDYPANFYWNTASKYGGVRTTRFFGYLRIPEPVKALGLAMRDGARFSLDGGTCYSHQFENTAGGVWSAAFDVPGLDPPAGPRIQFEKSTQGDNDLALGPFFSLKSGANVSDTGTTDLTNHRYTALGSSNGGDWKRIPKTYTVPLRITPPQIFEWIKTANVTFNRFFLAFGRDVASPTLYLFNAEDSVLIAFTPGGVHYKTDLTASITADTGRGMAITPDGQRLLIAADAPNRVHLIDISIPPQATYMEVVGHVDLPQPPSCIATRPFNRVTSRKNIYDVVATFTIEPPTGSNIAAVATGGIFLLGGTGVNQTDPRATIVQFNPANNSTDLLPKSLARKTGDPVVVAYDNELLAFNGMEAAPIGWVQKYNPTTGALYSSIDSSPPPGGTLVDLWVNPLMTAPAAPSPCAVTYTGTTAAGEEGWKAFDGTAVSGNLWAPLSANQTVIFNFGSTSLKAIVNSIQVNNVINPLTSGVKDFDLSGSNDGSSWTLLKSGTVSNNCNYSPSIDFSNATPYQYYSFKAKTNQGGGATYSSREIKLMYKGLRVVGPTMTSSVLPAPYSVTAQSEVSGSGWKIFDGNTSTWWETSGVTNAWVRIDLVTPDIVDVVRVMGKSDALAETTKNFKIQASYDDASWVDVSSTFVKPLYGDWNTFFFSNTTAYRYYRFVNESVQSGSQIKCPEVEFYSTQPPPTGGPPPGIYMSQTGADDNTTLVARSGHAGCMTPYGPVFGGGFAPTNATSTVQIYWPHAVAAGTPGPENMPDGCIGWYKFDELSGSVAVDSSKSCYDGTLNSMNPAGCWVAGRKNKCLEFDGVDDNVKIPGLSGNLTTICFWMKEEVAGPADWSGPFTQASSDSDGFQFRCSGTGYSPGFYSLKIGGTEYATTIPDTDQLWKHVALVRDGAVTKIYFNGVLNTTAPAVWTPAGVVRLGSNGNNDRWWSGKLDDLTIFNRVLSAAEIQQIATTDRPPLVRLRFDETSGNTALDSSGNDHHAVICNFGVPACWVAGKKNNCLDFAPSSNSVASIPDSPLWNLSGDFTICAWVNYDTFNNNWWEAAILGHDTGGGSQNKWIFSYDPGVTKGTLFHIQDTSGTGPTFKGSAWTAVAGTWYFLAVTKTGATYQFYRDGVPDGTVTNAYAIPDAAAPLTVGKAEGASSFGGKIDDVRIYNVALSASEIQAVMNSADSGYWGISRELPALPGNRVNHSLVWHKDKLYRIGGSDGASILATVDRFDPSSNTWTALTAAADTDAFTDTSSPGLFQRQYAGACSFGDEIFIFGGEYPAGTRLSTAAAWNPATRSMRKLKDIPPQSPWGWTTGSGPMTKGISAVPWGPFIFLMGGSNGAVNGTSKQILRYIP